MATTDEARAYTLAAFARFMPPQTPGEVARDGAALLARQGYTLAELRWAAARLPFDAGVAEAVEHKTQNPYFLLAATERIIIDARRTLSALGRVLNDFELSRLLDRCPDVQREDFHRAGYDGENRPLWRYAPNVKPSPYMLERQAAWDAGERPDEMPGQGRSRAGTGLQRLGEAL